MGNWEEVPVPVSGHIDPVCGMKVDAKSAAGSVSQDGESYYFCGLACRQKFEADPARYVRPSSAVAPGHSSGPEKQASEYTCPMHPEVRQQGRGNCPKCGMAVEPVAVSASRVQYVRPMHPRSYAASPKIVLSAAWLLSLAKSQPSRKKTQNCWTLRGVSG
jgi:Cu+-exporting ATPase